jgi:predicted MFS family arabinose efflux permease
LVARIVFWSVATFAGGLASSFIFFLIARAVVGLGEAAYAPAAQSMISGAFPQERRAIAQAIFATGMLLGGACGHVLGGILGPRYGWQIALFVVAFAGILPGIALFGIEEPPRGPRSEVVPISRLLRVPAFVSLICAGTCITFASVSLLTWSTDFAVNYKDFSLREASVSLAVIGLISALVGVLTGGFVAIGSKVPDLRTHHYRGSRVLAGDSIPLLAIQSEEKSTVLIGLSIAFFSCPGIMAPSAVLHDMMPRRAHATSIGVSCLRHNWLAGLGRTSSARSRIFATCRWGWNCRRGHGLRGVADASRHSLHPAGWHSSLNPRHVPRGIRRRTRVNKKAGEARRFHLAGNCYLMPICAIRRRTSLSGRRRADANHLLRGVRANIPRR